MYEQVNDFFSSLPLLRFMILTTPGICQRHFDQNYFVLNTFEYVLCKLY